MPRTNQMANKMDLIAVPIYTIKKNGMAVTTHRCKHAYEGMIELI